VQVTAVQKLAISSRALLPSADALEALYGKAGHFIKYFAESSCAAAVLRLSPWPELRVLYKK